VLLNNVIQGHNLFDKNAECKSAFDCEIYQNNDVIRLCVVQCSVALCDMTSRKSLWKRDRIIYNRHSFSHGFPDHVSSVPHSAPMEPIDKSAITRSSARLSVHLFVRQWQHLRVCIVAFQRLNDNDQLWCYVWPQITDTFDPDWTHGSRDKRPSGRVEWWTTDGRTDVRLTELVGRSSCRRTTNDRSAWLVRGRRTPSPSGEVGSMDST